MITLKQGAAVAGLASLVLTTMLVVLAVQHPQADTRYSLIIALDVLLILGALNLTLAHHMQQHMERTVRTAINELEERQAAEFLTRSDAALEQMAGRANVRSMLPGTRRGGGA